MPHSSMMSLCSTPAIGEDLLCSLTYPARPSYIHICRIVWLDARVWHTTSPTSSTPSSNLGHNQPSLYIIDEHHVVHRWGHDKFPRETPLLFYMEGQPLLPPLSMKEGLAAVVRSTLDYIENNAPAKSLKVWRLQSPRHFQGGGWSQNGTCGGSLLLNNTLVQKKIYIEILDSSLYFVDKCVWS